MGETIFGILLDRQMWEECEILQDVSHASFGHRSTDVRARVEQHALTHGNSPCVGSGQPGHAVEQCGFPRPRGAEQYGESRRGAEIHIKRKPALRGRKAFANACTQSWVCGF